MVKAPRSSGSKLACIRPASILEKSSRVFTSLPSRRPLRWITSSSPAAAASAGSAGSSLARSSSTGPMISVSGVRNSWLTLEKNVVLARSSSASSSARRSWAWYATAPLTSAAVC